MVVTVFDLGGVLYDFQGARLILQASRRRLELEEVRESPFHAHHPSHLSGFQKPDPRAFEVIARDYADESRFYFFDDRPDNVEAAAAFGWRARQVRSVGEARLACVELGLLER